MGWSNPPVPWQELEARLSGRIRRFPRWRRRRQPGLVAPSASPTSRRRSSGRPTPAWCPTPSCTATPTSASSTGPPTPRSWSSEAARLGLERPGPHRPRRLLRGGALRRGGPGRRAAAPCSAPSSPSGATAAARAAIADPRGRRHLVVLARDPEGYARLARAISQAQLPGREGRAPHLDLDELADAGRSRPAATTGRCSPGAARARCRPALVDDGPAAAGRELARLVEVFGREHVAVELWDHGDPLDSARNDALVGAGRARRGRRGRHQQRALRHPGPPPAGHRAGRGAGPAQPRRDGRLAAGLGRRPTCARGPSRPAASPATRAWSSGPPQLGRELRLRPGARRPRPAALPVPARPRRDDAGCAS